MKKTHPFINELTVKSRILEVLYDNLPNEIKEDELYNSITDYILRYVNYNQISIDQIIDFYSDFIFNYNKHAKSFIKTGKYPLQNDSNPMLIERLNYDVVLLMSVLFTVHRFKIMKLINNTGNFEKALFIGLGPGLELFLNKGKIHEAHAYDLSINDFLRLEFPNFEFNQCYYINQKNNYFDGIFIIEILEHLSDPYELINNCYNSLKKGGKLILTTATDIPQFDHLYNFPEDHTLFENIIKNIGFKINYKELIKHNYLTIGVNSSNHYYELEK